MNSSEHQRTESTAAIAGHPIHPFLVAFPIAFLIGGFLADIMAWHSADHFWPRVACWLIGAGLVTGLIASVAGFLDFVSIRRVRSLKAGWVHFIGNVIALVLTTVNFWLRLDYPTTYVSSVEVSLSGSVVFLLAITGWLGGELAFRHHIGMVGRQSDKS